MPYVVALLRSDNGVLALLSTDVIVEVTEMFDIDGDMIHDPHELARAVSAVAGPVPLKGGHTWIAFQVPGRHSVH